MQAEIMSGFEVSYLFHSFGMKRTMATIMPITINASTKVIRDTDGFLRGVGSLLEF
jgi:hypothetical protein